MKPILFNTDMVRAILEGNKTVTRRVVKPQPWGTCLNTGGDHELEPDNFCGGVATGFVCRRCGHGVCPPHMKYPVGEALFRPMCWPVDILYVRETWAANNITPHDPEWLYTADYDCTIEPYKNWRWHPSIHMPKEAARLFLRVMAVRVERLREITCEQAYKEGCTNPIRFDELWNSTIKPADLPLYSWDANPWVWVIEFERISREEA